LAEQRGDAGKVDLIDIVALVAFGCGGSADEGGTEEWNLSSAGEEEPDESDEERTRCVANADCPEDEVCSAGGQCLVNCEENGAACKASEECKETPSGIEGCVPTDDTDRDDDDDRDDDNDGDDRDDEDDDRGSGDSPYFLQIKDVTRSEITNDEDGDGTQDGAQHCDAGPSSAGADIGGVQLLDSDGNSVAWGTDDILNNYTNSSENQDAPSVLDGLEPSLAPAPEGGVECPSSDGSSPDFNEGTVVSLGCNGSVVVGFQDRSGNWVPVKEGYQVVVYEYAVACFGCRPNCGPSSDPVEYGREAVEVKVCDETDDPGSQEEDFFGATADSDGNLSQCSESLGSGNGAITTYDY